MHDARKPTTRPRLGSIFNETSTDRGRRVCRLDAVKITVDDLDEQEREQLRNELRELLWVLG